MFDEITERRHLRRQGFPLLDGATMEKFGHVGGNHTLLLDLRLHGVVVLVQERMVAQYTTDRHRLRAT